MANEFTDWQNSGKRRDAPALQDLLDRIVVLEATVASGVRSGTVRSTAEINTPTGWLDCDGSAVSRTTYAALFSVITINTAGTRTNGSPIITGLASTAKMSPGMPVSGANIPAGTTILTVDSGTQVTLSANATAGGATTLTFAPFGVGDGSTTFNVPDMRGKVAAGKAGSGTFLRLGQSLGVESAALSVAELPAHAHAITAQTTSAESSHTHPISATTGTESADHTHSGTTGTDSVDHVHSSYPNNYINSAINNYSTGGSQWGVNGWLVANSGGASAFHTHSITTGGRSVGHTHSFSSTSGAGSSHTHSLTGTTANIGSGSAVSKLQPSLTLNYIIKT